MRLSERLAIWLCALFMGGAAFFSWQAKEESLRQPWMVRNFVVRYLVLETTHESKRWSELAECHRQVDVVVEVIRVIESRRGNEPPRLLDEARYRGKTDPVPFVPGTGELSQ